MEQNNKLILQSYKLTSIRNDFGIYAQRLIVRIAQAMQYRLEDADFVNKELKPIDPRLIWHFKAKDLMRPEDNNYTAVKRELRKVIKASVYFEDEHGWRESVIFPNISADIKGEIEVEINRQLWDIFIEFSKGYKRYELESALSLSSTYALRLYQLISENAEPITYTIDWLKQLFQIQGKYAENKRFIERVIQPAQGEINAKCPTGFDYKVEYKPNGKGRPAMHAITFYTYRNDKAMTNTQKDMANLGNNAINAVDKDSKRALREKYGFTDRELKNNAKILAVAEMGMENPTLAEFLATRLSYAQKADKPKAYIIGAIRAELAEQMKK